MARASDNMAGTKELREIESLRWKEEHQKLLRWQQLILDSAWEGILSLDLQGNHTFINPAAARILGYEIEELLGRSSHAICHHSRAAGIPYPETECPITVTLQQGTTHHVTSEVFWRKDGTSFPVEYTSTPILENNEVVGGVVTFWDVSERKEAEELSRNLMAWSPVGIYLIQDRKFVLANHGFQAITGYTEDELLHLTTEQLVHPEDRRQVRRNAIRMLRGKGFVPYEYRAITKGGEVRWIMETATSIQYQGRRASLGYFMDITERKQLESQFLQAQKMEVLTRLAGGLAHDFSNMLGIIILYVAIILKDISPDDAFYPHVKGIKEAAEQAVSLTRQLQIVSRRQPLKPQAIDLDTIITGTAKMLRPLLGEDIELVLKLEPTVLVINLDPGQLEQVLINLAVNARDAMPQGGHLTIETAKILLGEPYTAKHIDVTPGNYAMLTVSDTGMGMDDETKAHIFEPFFTTKETGVGNGLGLSAVYGIVKQGGGFIEVDTEPRKGTAFKIFFPLIEIRAQMESPTGMAESTPQRGSETILVVEDEDKLRELVSDSLEAYGYTVLTARHGEEALLICEQYQRPIHLILTDAVMPKMGGKEFMEGLGSSHPETRVLYMSGYAAETLMQRRVLNSTEAFIQKPFSTAILIAKLRELLDSPKK
jgi:two-component system, cell cycle sensor histidine kinase and response regulator CckA